MEVLAPLVEHPGKWAVVKKAEDNQKASTTAASLRKDTARKPEGKWEFVARQGEVFARYVGPE
jgi:hypothetical protein